jgi:hypothetical protein
VHPTRPRQRHARFDFDPRNAFFSPPKCLTKARPGRLLPRDRAVAWSTATGRGYLPTRGETAGREWQPGRGVTGGLNFSRSAPDARKKSLLPLRLGSALKLHQTLCSCQHEHRCAITCIFFVVLVVYYRYSFYATCCICHEKCSYLHDLYQYEYDASTDIFLRTYVIFF